MVGWVASLVVIADDAASTELFSLFCELCLICVLDMTLYVLFMLYVCFSCVYTCPRVSSYERMNELDHTYTIASITVFACSCSVARLSKIRSSTL